MVDKDDVGTIKTSSAPFYWRKNHERFKPINIISEPFHQAAELCVGKIYKSHLIGIEYEGNGTFLYKKKDGVVESYCFDFKVSGTCYEKLLFYYFQDDCLVCYVNTHDGMAYLSSDSVVLADGITRDERINAQIRCFFDYYLFIMYAQVETKQLGATARIKTIDCKYVNETQSNVQIKDSTWFTTLVKSDAFKVHGHFRLQPKKKDGEWTKELIWIKDFQKGGYTRKAGILQ